AVGWARLAVVGSPWPLVGPSGAPVGYPRESASVRAWFQALAAMSMALWRSLMTACWCRSAGFTLYGPAAGDWWLSGQRGSWERVEIVQVDLSYLGPDRVAL